LGLIDEVAYWTTVPSTTNEMDSGVTNRWNGGAGNSYGGSGTVLYSQVGGLNASAGNLLQISSGLRREITTVVPEIDAISVVFE
jgi:hypothetical protein